MADWLTDLEIPLPYQPALVVTAVLSLILAACSQSGDSDSGRSGTDVPLYLLSGTVATGRAGSWAEVCIEGDCSRANSEGVYRLLEERSSSALLTASIPNADQTTTELTSLYRHDTGQTVALVNVNPTTNALLDSWSRSRQSRPLADCILSTTCRDELASSFTSDRQGSAQQQLQNWLAPYWETARNPFSEPYVADPEADWLDDLHDHLRLEATEFGLNAVDNEGAVLATLRYETLFDDRASLTQIGQTTLDAAYAINPPLPEDTSPIDIEFNTTPASPFTAPVEWQADVSGSRSGIAGDLFFQHTLVGPDGRVTTGSGSLFSATLSDPGPYTWTVVVTDSENNQTTTGLSLQTNASDIITNPSFGAEGSCSTSPLTANASNVCISTVDGGSLGACSADTSGSIRTRYSPAPCSPVSQQSGVFLGTCTSLLNQIRVYHYDNPIRDTGETIPEQQTRLDRQCVTDLGRAWSSLPPE
jgi:hypothetical protein